MPRTKGGDLQDDVAKQLFTYFLGVGHLVQKELFKHTPLWSRYKVFLPEVIDANSGRISKQVVFSGQLSSWLTDQIVEWPFASVEFAAYGFRRMLSAMLARKPSQKRQPNRYASLDATVDKLHLSDSEFDLVLPETCTLVRTRSASSFLTDWSDSDDSDAVPEAVTSVPEMKSSTLDSVTAMPAASELCRRAAREEESCNVIAISDCDSEQELALHEAKLFDKLPPLGLQTSAPPEMPTVCDVFFRHH